MPPHEEAECGICSRETPPEMVARLARQKAENVVEQIRATGAVMEDQLVIGCDTVAFCCGHILGKPRDERHAAEMLRLLSGRQHEVYSGLCLWPLPTGEPHVAVDMSRLQMERLDAGQIDAYLATEQWRGKAGAFGYQDGWDWLKLTEGSASNVVGLPLELLVAMLREFAG